MKPKVINLFSGCGGLSQGLKLAGFKLVLGCDNDESALKTFKHNHPRVKTQLEDIAQLSSKALLKRAGLRRGDLFCLVGGPPCQGFSRNRPNRQIDGRFVDDPRNYLFKEFMRIVRDLRPPVIVMENVPEILTKKKGRFKREIFTLFDQLGYSVAAKVLNAADYGVPQLRRRAFFLAYAKRMKITPSFPEPTHSRSGHKAKPSDLPKYVTVWEAMSDLPSLKAGQGKEPCKYAHPPSNGFQRERRKKNRPLYNHIARNLTAIQMNRIKSLGQGEGLAHLPRHLRTNNGYGSAYRRMDSKRPALTITTWMYHPGSGMFIHPYDNRVITIREGARLQSFDDNFRFYGSMTSQCRQVGNAVPPLVAKKLAKKILQDTKKIVNGMGSNRRLQKRHSVLKQMRHKRH